MAEILSLHGSPALSPFRIAKLEATLDAFRPAHGVASISASFHHFVDVEQALDASARAILDKLLTYALGRGLEQYDARTVKLVASRLPARDYRFSALVLEIVNSLPFQSRRPSSEDPRTQKGTPAP